MRAEPALPLTARALAPRRRAARAAVPVDRLADGTLLRNVSVAQGNVMLADHGLTTTQTDTPADLTVDGRLVQYGPLTMEQRR